MKDALAALGGRSFDVVIIGGGISGASCAQHLSAAGYSVLMVEKGDFASAATSRSSRLLHSGLRYLAPPSSLWAFLKSPGRFLDGISMARQSSRVSDDFILTSPHAVRTTRLLIPIFESSAFRGWQVDLGVAFLKLIGQRKVPLNYRRSSAAEAQRLPFIRWLRTDDRLQSVVQIDDHQFVWPERICLDAVLDAERMGATVLNYTTAEGIKRTGNAWEVVLRTPDGGEAKVSGTVLLNLAGVWVDRVNGLVAAARPPKRKVVGVKGVSIAVKLPAECEGYGLAGINSEGDAIMCVPWGGLHYIGPTETVYEGDIDDVKPEDSDIDFLITEINRLMPGINMDRSCILHAWAGVRPITYDTSRAKGRRMPFSVIHDLSREGLPNMLTVTWAAVMFHRVTARRIVKRVQGLISPSRAPQPLRLGAARRPDDRSPPLVASRPEVTKADIVRCVEQEHAKDLVGILYSRTGLGWNAGIPAESVREAARLVAPLLGWDAPEIERRVDAYLAHVRKYHLISSTDWSA
jgi:glycerol-3-phosphate dehydrogenase